MLNQINKLIHLSFNIFFILLFRLKHVKMDSGGKEKPQKESEENVVVQLKQILEKNQLHINNLELNPTNENAISDNEDNTKTEEKSRFGIKELKLIVSEYETLKDTYEALQKQVEQKYRENEGHVKLIEEQKSEIKQLQNNNLQ